jgi:tRNA pseudouridine38-40 synthase
MNNYKMMIQYDGTRYRGWQRLNDSDCTIQGKIEQVLEKMLGESIEICGAGRTDAGVHAKEQVANFHCTQSLDEDKTLLYLNEYLPKDIRVTKVSVASPRFHSRLNAVGKVYCYEILKAGHYNVFQQRYMWEMNKNLNLDRMRQAAQFLVGEHDFAGFCTKTGKKKSSVRQIFSIDITESKDTVRITFSGNGFLYNMVRIITGTLVEVGLGKKTVEDVSVILDTKDRSIAGEKAPANGLTLVKVQY